MGCGASSSKGSAPAGPTPKATGAAAQPATPTKQASDLTPGGSQSAASTPQKPRPESSSGSNSQKAATASPPPPAAAAPAPAVAASPPAAAAPASPSPPADPAPAAAAPAPAAPKDTAPVQTPTPPARPGSGSASGPAAALPPRGSFQTRLPPLPSGSMAKLQPPPADTSCRPVLQVPKLVAGAPVSCLTPPPPLAPASPGAPDLPADTAEQVNQLASGVGGAADQAAAAASVRQLLCRPRPPVQALLDAGVAAALVRCLREGPQEAKLDAAWSLTNIASSPVYEHVEAICNAEATGALLAALGVGKLVRPTRGSQTASGTGGLAPLLAAAAAAGGGDNGASARPASAGGPGRKSGEAAPPPASPAAAALREQALWALANIAGVVHPEYKTQTLAVEVLDLGALGAVMAILEAEEAVASASARPASAPGSGFVSRSGSVSSGSVRPILRCAAWCLHNLAKHKREKEMVDVIPLATRLLLSCPDPECLTCLAWVLAYLGSNEDNKSHMKQALPALPRLVPWIRAADSPLATPALLCVGTLCTGYMRSLDYSGEVVEAGGVPAFLSYLRKGSESDRRDMVTDALFALSNVAGANNATVRAMLEAGAFTEVTSILRGAGSDEEIRMECLYVLSNAWDPLVGAEAQTVQEMLAAGILDELDRELEASAPTARLDLLLKGLTDGVKRGQMVMTYTASMMLVELGREGAAAAPPPTNPVVDLYGRLGTVDRITALNSHPDAEVATKANGILTVLKFMS